MRAARVLFFLLGYLAVTACGGDRRVDPADAPTGRWSTARLPGVREATGLAALGDRLLVATAGGRALRVVEVDDVRAGADLASRELPIEAPPELYVGGSGTFAAQGYQVADLWRQPVLFTGLAAQEPGYVFLAERHYRVVYVGRVYQAPDGSWRSLGIDRVFTLPGADRRDASASDWRDKGPGVAGLAAVKGERRSADLYLADAGDPDAGTFQLTALDRFGLVLKTFTVDMTEGMDPDVGGVLREEGRCVVVRGPARGTLHGVKDGAWHETIPAGRGVPGPEIEGVVRWSGMGRSMDGTWWLVSAGDPAILAWRRP